MEEIKVENNLIQIPQPSTYVKIEELQSQSDRIQGNIEQLQIQKNKVDAIISQAKSLGVKTQAELRLSRLSL